MKVYVEIDVRTINYTLATVVTFDDPIKVSTYSPKLSNIDAYCIAAKKQFGKDAEIITGYEAGTLVFPLRRDLEKRWNPLYRYGTPYDSRDRTESQIQLEK